MQTRFWKDKATSAYLCFKFISAPAALYGRVSCYE